MIQLISIHIPKTAGTSFHRVLQSVYGQGVSPSLRRRDVPKLLEGAALSAEHLNGDWSVIHGHLRYREVAGLQRQTGADLICWLRHPAERVISNHAFFIDRLEHPEINPEVSAANAHRRGESLLEYAALPENRNRMSWFMEDALLETFRFIGIQEHFEEDLATLARTLGWPAVQPPRLNEGTGARSVDPAIHETICQWNADDMELYRKALGLRANGHFINALR